MPGTNININASWPSWDDVRRIADEIELKVHLASMDVRDRWAKLQPDLVALERSLADKGQRATEAVAQRIGHVGKALEKLRADLLDKSS